MCAGSRGEVSGDVVEYAGGDAVTLWPQDQTLSPLHLTIQVCEREHAAG